MGYHKDLTGLDLHEPTNKTVLNDGVATILALRVVKYTGLGTSYPTIAPIASYSDTPVGVTYDAITSGQTGSVILLGHRYDVNTTAYSPGQVLYSDDSGVLVSSETTLPVARVITSAASGVVFFYPSMSQEFNGASLDISYISGIVDANTASIVTNDADISYISGQVDVNAIAIASNDADIAWISGQVGTDVNLDYISGVVDSNIADIAWISGQVVTDADLDYISGVIDGNTAAITGNDADIDYLSGVIDYVSGAVDSNANAIISNDADIAWISGQVGTGANISYLSGVIDYVSGVVTSNDADITYISGQVALNDADIAWISGQVGTDVNLDYISGVVDSNTAAITNNDADIAWISGQVGTGANINYLSGVIDYVSGQVTSNDDDITYISGQVSLNDADINWVSGEVITGSANINTVAYFDGAKSLSGNPNLTNDGINVKIYGSLPTNPSVHNGVLDNTGYVGYTTLSANVLSGSDELGIKIDVSGAIISQGAEDGAGYLYFTDRGTGNIYIVNPLTDTIVQTVSSANPNKYTDTITYCPVEKRMLVSNDEDLTTGVSDGRISVFSTLTWQHVCSINISGAVSGGAIDDISEMAFCPTNGLVYGAWDSSVNPHVFVIDPSTCTQVAQIDLTHVRSWGICYCPLNERLYVGHIASDTGVTVINPFTNTIETVIGDGTLDQPQQGVYCPKNQLIYFGGSFTNEVYVIDPMINEVIDTISYDSDNGSVRKIQSIFWSPKKEYLYMVGYSSGTTTYGGVRVLDPLTHRTITQMKFGIPGNCKYMVYSRHTGLMYATNLTDNYIVPIL